MPAIYGNFFNGFSHFAITYNSDFHNDANVTNQKITQFLSLILSFFPIRTLLISYLNEPNHLCPVFVLHTKNTL